jgi:hypothetical protein
MFKIDAPVSWVDDNGTKIKGVVVKMTYPSNTAYRVVRDTLGRLWTCHVAHLSTGES